MKEGRFAFWMERETEDLHVHLDRLMMMRASQDCRLFSNDDAEVIMYSIALGMDWLHDMGIVHKLLMCLLTKVKWV